MPFSPSDLLWWQWFLVAIGAGVAALISWLISAYFEDNHPNGGGAGLFGLVGFLSMAACGVSAVIGFIRFIKWAWA